MDIISYLKPLLAHQGYDIELSRQKARGFDVLINILDGTALREKTGWLPRINFEIGLERTVTWMVAHCREEFSKLGDHG
jgi:nucleoside-diphosphate-sugar epimerase